MIERLRTHTGSDAATARLLRINGATIRHWKAGSRTPDGRSWLLMRVFDENPELIEEYGDE